VDEQEVIRRKLIRNLVIITAIVLGAFFIGRLLSKFFIR